MANPLSKLPIANTTRRNHALEHATMSVLAAKYPGVKMAGMSNPTGFVLFADLSIPTAAPTWSPPLFWLAALLSFLFGVPAANANRACSITSWQSRSLCQFLSPADPSVLASSALLQPIPTWPVAKSAWSRAAKPITVSFIPSPPAFSFGRCHAKSDRAQR